MLELNEQDIRVVAQRRFASRNWLKLIGAIVGVALPSVVIMHLLDFDSLSLGIRLAIFSGIMVLLFGVMVWWLKAQAKTEKALLKECEKDAHLTYIPTPSNKHGPPTP